MKNQKAEIKTELKLSLEALSLLSGHDTIDKAWDDLKTVIAKAISIKKINNYRTLISKYGVDWYKEYYNDEGNKDKVNPVRLIADVWGNSSENGFDCKEKNGEWKGYFNECDNEVKTDDDKKARVVRVLKSTVKAGTGSERNYYVPIKSGSTSWVMNKPIKSSLRSGYSGTVSTKGKLGELVVETCDQYWGLWNWGQKDFCRTILEKFFGADVKDKRYCFYEMPETEEDLTSATFFKKRKND